MDILSKRCLFFRNFELVLWALGTWWEPIRGTFLVPFEEESKYPAQKTSSLNLKDLEDVLNIKEISPRKHDTRPQLTEMWSLLEA
jgi:hypothetical protein